MRLLGSTKLTTGNKITLIDDAPKILNVKVGDPLLLYEDGGKIIIKSEKNI